VRATVITDASFCAETKASGWAAWIRIDGHPAPIKAYGSFKAPVDSATDAELLAALNGLWLAHRHGATSALLQTDCLAVVEACSHPRRQKKVREKWLAGLEHCALGGFPVAARHVRGHTRTQDARSYVNRWCDKHAKRSMREARSAGGVVECLKH
jgi:ribonuclease HI